MSSYYRQARFLISSPDLAHAPPDVGAEVAFGGRSNAGKSSAINTITDQTGLARTSKTPGRTQLINFFELDGERRLVDLPGYGFARVAEPVRRKWGEALEVYLRERQSLRGLVQIMDVRHPLKELDVQMIEWCQHIGLPLHVLLTKADKLKQGPANATLKAVRRELEAADMDATAQLFSATKRRGLDQVYARLDDWLSLDKKNPGFERGM